MLFCDSKRQTHIYQGFYIIFKYFKYIENVYSLTKFNMTAGFLLVFTAEEIFWDLYFNPVWKKYLYKIFKSI